MSKELSIKEQLQIKYNQDPLYLRKGDVLKLQNGDVAIFLKTGFTFLHKHRYFKLFVADADNFEFNFKPYTEKIYDHNYDDIVDYVMYSKSNFL